MATRTESADAHGGARRLTRRRLAGACAGLLVAGLADAIETPPPLGTCGPISRRHEHVELRTRDLRKLARTPLGQVGVLVRRAGALDPIPFQIDERQGSTIAMPDGDEPSVDARPGVLDPDDVLVFLPCDAGVRATPAALAARVPGLTTWREVQVDDPIDGSRGFAYVVVAPAPPATGRHYVAYEPTADLVSTATYRIGMVEALPSYFAVAMRAPLGPNLLDGLRLRAEATLRGSVATFDIDETDARHVLIAWKAGPVRVVRRSRHDVKLLGIPLQISAGTANTSFYPLHVFGPGALKLPISPGFLFREIQAMGGVDLRDLRGWRFVAAGTPPDGFAIDGTMDDAERAFQADGTWFVLVHETEAILVTITLSENLAKAIPFGVAYVDDAGRRSPPERETGSVPLVGFRGRGLERLPADRYRFDLRVFLLPAYRPGDAARVLRQRDVPLSTTVNVPPNVPTTRGAGRATPP
jgi:hypothetical protein